MKSQKPFTFLSAFAGMKDQGFGDRGEHIIFD
jgi:hypothetical protein